MDLHQPRPYGAQGVYIKTHDFLQPLERSGGNGAKEESTVEEITTEEKPPLPIAPSSGEHVLPGGVGTYSITHISSYFNQRVPKSEGTAFTAAQATAVVEHNEENSNCSSHTGSGFMLWEEPAVEKGKTGKENHSSDNRNSAPGRKIGGAQGAALERPAWSSSNIATNTPNHLTGTTTFTSRSSSQPPFQKSQSFMDMLKSAKAAHNEDGEDEEEYNLKKEASPQLQSDLMVKVGNGCDKGTDQKPNTPRSKHSATEQRRRSKINDRFHMLRELIPHGDQKRDKASLLLEVIEYIQYLQDKVHKYEGSYQEWDQELPKLMPWQRNNNHSKDPDTNHKSNLALTTKFEENGVDFSLTSSSNEPKDPRSDMKAVTNLQAIDHHFGLANQALHVQKNIITPGENANVRCPTPAWLASDSGLTNAARNKLKEQESTVESGVISVSTVYSQGLLNTLTQALQSSGVDLSHADISVQIDLGKRANGSLIASTSAIKDHDIRDSNQVMGISRGASCGDQPSQECKRLRTS